ncbi:heme-degrading domain-containing protein [Kineosporia babensis]|uniref:UPF0303 protein LR394_02520 n=1 Tax=Kineosporia babensis TaxID=499548 RepID=A0A9X1N8Y2_9ACTN|nr:heme-degrading domain-containing protein [Kineosporia babensis]MCD5309755.1 heme-degrading domain-containing protein [Kineosporia babensis]
MSELDALIEELEDQERRLRLPGFDNDDAWQIGIILVELAAARRAPVTVDLRRNGQQLFHYALPGTSADNDAWILRKAAVVDRFGQSSLLVGRRAAADGVSFEERFRLDPQRYAAHGGSFPVHVHGVGTVGTVTVSGLPEVEDHMMVVAGLEQYLEDLSKN